MNRLDELLNALDNASDRYGVKLTSTSAAYIASLLRAGRELAEAAKERYEAKGIKETEYGNQFSKPSWWTLGDCVRAYDRAVEGDNAEG